MSTLAVNSIIPANAGSENYFLIRAWANVDCTGTPSIRASGNISSINDAGVGSIGYNFANAAPSTNISTTQAQNGPVNTHHVHGFLQENFTAGVSIGYFRDETSANRADPSLACLHCIYNV